MPSFLTPNSEMALDDLSALKHIPRLQLLPSIHRAHLDTHKVLVCILGLEIRHRLIFLNPRIPYHSILEVVPGDVEARLAVRGDGGRVLFDGLIHTVGLAGDGEGRRGLRVLGSVEDFVDV